MANVTPGYTFTGTTDPITYTKLNLLGQPTVTIGTNEVTVSNLAQVVGANIYLGRITAGTGNVAAIDMAASGMGYRAGAGGAVTQATSKATAFTLSKVCGQITTAADALNAATIVSATWTNTLIAATDVVAISHVSGGTSGAYTFNVQPGAGTATLTLRNNTAGNLSEALVLSFVVLKSAIT